MERDTKHLLIGAVSIVAFLIFVMSAKATTTWTSPGTTYAKAGVDGGTGQAPTTISQGLKLDGLKGFTVFVESTSLQGGGDGGPFGFTAGSLRCYLWNPVSAAWARAPEMDLTVTAGLTSQSFPGFTVTAPRGRIAYIPDGLVTPVSIYINGTP